MKLLGLHICGFRKFHDRTVAFQDEVSAVYDSNEVDKPTPHAFIRGTPFGVERRHGRAVRDGLYSKYEP